MSDIPPPLCPPKEPGDEARRAEIWALETERLLSRIQELGEAGYGISGEMAATFALTTATLARTWADLAGVTRSATST